MADDLNQPAAAPDGSASAAPMDQVKPAAPAFPAMKNPTQVAGGFINPNADPAVAERMKQLMIARSGDPMAQRAALSGNIAPGSAMGGGAAPTAPPAFTMGPGGFGGGAAPPAGGAPAMPPRPTMQSWGRRPMGAFGNVPMTKGARPFGGGRYGIR